MIRQKWVTAPADESLVEKLSAETGKEKSRMRILVSRNIDTAEKINSFLNPDINKLYSPFLLKDMDKAAARIKKALEKGEKIAVYGDYDVDGITGVTVLLRFLRAVGGNCIYYIPDRQNDGYGLNKNAVDLISREGASMILTVDCGVTAGELGMDVVVTDHHKCPETLPECAAVVDPKREDSDYPFRELAGVGVAFKLINAMGLDIPEEVYKEILFFAAVQCLSDGSGKLVRAGCIIISAGIAF